MPLCCVECKPCNNGHCLPIRGPGALFTKSRRPGPAQQLRRALGKMNLGLGGTRRRRPRRPGSFSSVRAVFWPLISMRSDAADARNDNDDGDARPPPDSSSSPSFPNVSVTVRAPDGDAAASATAARVLALQARLGGSAAAAGDDEEAKALIVVARHGGGGEVEAACRRFERHVMEMVVEEGKVMDLTDVEELLCCWEKLRCPALVRLVGRFYGELCLDLFSSAVHEDDADADVLWPSHQSEAFLP